MTTTHVHTDTLACQSCTELRISGIKLYTYTYHHVVCYNEVEQIFYYVKYIIQKRKLEIKLPVFAVTPSPVPHLSGSRVGGGHHQLVCSPAGHTVGDMNI